MNPRPDLRLTVLAYLRRGPHTAVARFVGNPAAAAAETDIVRLHGWTGPTRRAGNAEPWPPGAAVPDNYTADWLDAGDGVP